MKTLITKQNSSMAKVEQKEMVENKIKRKIQLRVILLRGCS